MYELENYKKEKLTVNLVWANIFAILILIPIFFVFGIPYYLIWHSKLDSDIGLDGLYIFGAFILGIIVHELIHGIIWARYAKNGFKSMKFGVLWKMITPYCHCKEPLKVRHYIIGAIAPAIILGLIPSIIAIIIGNLELLIFGMVFTIAAGGDFLIINLIRKENKDDLVQDHPSEVGCFIYRKID
jgi:hypothetical protein